MKPFYSDDVWVVLDKLNALMRKESQQFTSQNSNTDKYWDCAVKNQDEILSKIEDVCTAIRKRIKSLAVVDK